MILNAMILNDSASNQSNSGRSHRIVATAADGSNRSTPVS